MIYLDYNATTPVLPEVFEAMKPYFLHEFGNAGSRTHIYGLNANKAVETARKKIAGVVNCDPGEVIFTSGATESNNLAILGFTPFGQQHQRRHIITSSIEHKSVLEPLKVLAKQGFLISHLPVNNSGLIYLDDLKKELKIDTLLVSIMQVNNETGVIQPISEIANFLEEYPEVYFHVDAAQSFGKIIDQLQHPRIDMISISGHKIYAPKGIGALIMRRRNRKKIPLQPLMYGGGQEKTLRPGTLPVPLIAGLGKAAEMALANHPHWHNENKKKRDEALKVLSEIEYEFNGNTNSSLPHILNLSFPGINSEAIFIALKNIAAISNGSACTSSQYQPSHVLKAMGYSQERIESSVRISWGVGCGEIPWKGIVDILKSFIPERKWFSPS